jgi:hypothetical protein
MLNPDFKDMLYALSAHNVDFLLVGAYAMATHGLPRATGDLDLWIRPTSENASRVMKALADFGAPLRGLNLDDLATEGTVFQIGVQPNRIDLLTKISGVDFEQAYNSRLMIELDGLSIPVIGRQELLINKLATDRPKDKLDAEWLAKQH